MASRFRRMATDNTVPLDMTPMIDCIFLLLIFFILTSSFIPDDLAIASLMPTDKGGTMRNEGPPILREQVNIKIYPAGMTRGHQPSDYRQQLAELRNQQHGRPIDTVWIQVGGDPPLEIQGAPFRLAGGSDLTTEMERFHAHLHGALDARASSANGPSASQPIVIHCFSGLSWKFALLAYDAVRDYERVTRGDPVLSTRAELLHAREVTFAPPRLRNYDPNEVGNELAEILHQR